MSKTESDFIAIKGKGYARVLAMLVRNASAMLTRTARGSVRALDSYETLILPRSQQCGSERLTERGLTGLIGVDSQERQKAL